MLSCAARTPGAHLGGENLSKLVKLMERLRGPEGCPWDRVQTYASIKGLLLEEAYEVIDAIEARDFDALEDELGDLLFQVVFYSRLAQEEDRFSIDGVIERVHRKLVRRHPHVFGDVQARTPEEALRSWTAVKEQERQAESKRGNRSPSVLDGISPGLPSTLEAHELGLRASEVGFDWARAEDLLEKIEEEIRELRRELKDELARSGARVEEVRERGRPGPPESHEPATNGARVEEELGDLLFAVANLARYLRSDAETCLRRANRKFKRRFQALEEELARRGRKVRECTPTELERLWEELKARERGSH